MKTFAVAGVQMMVSAHEDNIALMERYAVHIRTRFPWVGMLLFSELAAFGPDPSKAVAMPGEVEARLCGIAKRHGLWLIPGSLFERRGGCTYNTAPVIDAQGQVIARFSKMFPFRPYEEGIAAGTEFVVFDVPEEGRFSVSICYDMWFPETTRQMVAMGAEVILHPTMTDTIDRDAELSIARASAVMNQCYFFDINGIGAGGNGRSERQYGFFRPYVSHVIYRYLDCGDLHNGFARVRCGDCGHEYLLAFSCKRRHFCPSCHQKRVVEFGEWLCGNVVKGVPHRHIVFSIPKILRRCFLYDRKRLTDLSRCGWESLKAYFPSCSMHSQVVTGP